MYASPAACLRSPVEIGALPIMRSCSPGNPDIRPGQATACLPRLRPCPQRSRRDSASGSSRRRKQLSTGKTQPDAKLRERESRNRNRQRKTLMLIFSSTERASQGLGGKHWVIPVRALYKWSSSQPVTVGQTSGGWVRGSHLSAGCLGLYLS